MGYQFRKFRPETFSPDELTGRGWGGQGLQKTYNFSLFTKEGVALHGVVAVGGNEVEDVVVGGVC